MQEQYPQIALSLQDEEWPLDYIDHDREIVRAIVFDDSGIFHFVRADRDDIFGKAIVIETAGGGVESSEDLHTAIARELKEELGVTVDVLGEIGTVSDYYNLIHRHNINHYFLCRVTAEGETSLTPDEIETFHLSTLKLPYDEAVKEYELRSHTRLGKLIADRELPVLRQAKQMLEHL